MKKLSYVMAATLVGTIALSSQSNFTFAQEEAPTRQGVWSEIVEFRQQKREERRDLFEENRDQAIQERNEKKREFGQEMKENIFSNLEEEVHEQLRTINQEYKTQMESLHTQYDNPHSEEFRAAIQALVEERDAAIIAVLPEDVATQYQEFIDQVRAELDADKAENEAERQAMLDAHFSETTLMMVEQFDSIFDQIEERLDGNVARLDAFYTKIIEKIGDVIQDIDTHEKLSDDLKQQRTEMLEAIIVSLQEKQDNLGNALDTEGEITDILEEVLD